MYHSRWLPLALLLLTPAARGDAESTARLVRGLSADAYADRQRAAAELRKLGTAALPALREAAASGDAEARRLARRCVKRIENEAENRRLLTPPMVALNYRDVPLRGAVADFAKRTGLRIDLHPSVADRDRKVTAVSTELPLWQAFDRLCRAAGLREMPPAKSPRVSRYTPHNSYTQALQLAGRAAPRIVSPGAGSRPVLLGDGQPSTSVAADTAVRVRAETPAAGDRFTLELRPAPSLEVREVLGVSLTRVTAGDGGRVAQAMTSPPAMPFITGPNSAVSPGAPIVFQGGGQVIIRGGRNIVFQNGGVILNGQQVKVSYQTSWGTNTGSADPFRVEVRLEARGRELARLREIEGYAYLRVSGREQDVWRVTGLGSGDPKFTSRRPVTGLEFKGVEEKRGVKKLRLVHDMNNGINRLIVQPARIQINGGFMPVGGGTVSNHIKLRAYDKQGRVLNTVPKQSQTPRIGANRRPELNTLITIPENAESIALVEPEPFVVRVPFRLQNLPTR